jgi:hypothetical protein
LTLITGSLITRYADNMGGRSEGRSGRSPRRSGRSRSPRRPGPGTGLGSGPSHGGPSSHTTPIGSPGFPRT